MKFRVPGTFILVLACLFFPGVVPGAVSAETGKNTEYVQAENTVADPEQAASPENIHSNDFAFFFEVKRERHWIVTTMLYALLAIAAVIIIYTIRHFRFTLNRLFGRQ